MNKYIQKYESIKRASSLAIQKSEDIKNIAEDVLTNVVIETIRKYQQKINVGIQDSVNDLLENFKKNVSESIFNIASNWRVENSDYILFPRGCRFCYKKGNNTIVIIEQEPQIRSLLFESSMLEEMPVKGVSNSERIALALPYIVFIIHFKKNHFMGMYTGWRNAPLNDLNADIFRPFLPNIHENFSVCTGITHKEMEDNMSGDNITQKCDFVLSHFWNSKFNCDLSNFWWKKGDFDDRLISARTWSKFSLLDSSFILMVFHSEAKSIEYFLNILTMHDYELDEVTLKHTISETIDKCVEGLFFKITRYFRNTKFEKYHPKEISDILKRIIIDSNSEVSETIFTIKFELQKLEAQITNYMVRQDINYPPDKESGIPAEKM